MKSILFLNAFLASLALFAADLNVPMMAGLKKKGAILSASLPWNGNFTLLGTAAKPGADTRFKIAHDGRYLYLGIEAFEPEMKKLKSEKFPDDHPELWRNDSIEINFDPDGRNAVTGKIVIDPNGNTADYLGLDDNTGNENFTLDIGWNSRAEIISAHMLSDRWTVEIAIPFGVFFDGEQTDISRCRFNVGRNRTAVREATSFAVIKTNFPGHGKPRFFPQLVLEKFDASRYHWKINSLALTGRKADKICIAGISAKVMNLSPLFKAAQVRAILKDKKSGTIFSKSAAVPGAPGNLFTVTPEIFDVKPGKYTLSLELADTAGDLLALLYLANAELEFQPMQIRMIEPSYRDNIYASQKLDHICAEIRLEEGIGKPLEIVLSAPDGFSKTVKIPSAQAVNQVSFPFVDMPAGIYQLKAGDIVRKLRKLPYVKGEVFFDGKNICHTDGKPFFAYGFYLAYPEWKPRGANVAILPKNNWKSPEEVKAWLDRYFNKGIRLLLYPYMEPSGKPVLFTEEARKQGKLTEEQKKSVASFIAAAKDHPGIFGYYVADEPEGTGQNENWYEDLHQYLSELDPWHPVVITNYGVSGQRQFYQGCDLLQPDNYPNYFCDKTNTLPRSSSYTSALHASSLRPAWMIIHCFDWGKWSINGAHSRSPNYDELREQSWLGILGNVKGITCYVFHTWGNLSYQLTIGRNYLGCEFDALKDLILQNTVPVEISPADRNLFAGMKNDGKRFLVIAVNTSETEQSFTFQLKGKENTSLAVSGEKRSVVMKDGAFTDRFRPHETHIYLSEGIESDSVDHQAVREEIRKADISRKKPGNLAAAGELTLTQIKDYKKEILPAGVPRITVSTELATHYWETGGAATGYFLQDGICDTEHYQVMTWTPLPTDRNPWIEIDFGKAITAERVVFYLYRWKGECQLRGVRIKAATPKGTFHEVASFSGNQERCREIRFSPVSTRKIRIEITDWNRQERLLDEIEIYGK